MKNQLYEGYSMLEVCLDRYNTRSLFIVCHPTSYQRSGAREKTQALLTKRNCSLTLFSDFDLNPKFDDIMKGIDRFKASGCDTILAIGGGSAIDTAKCIGIMSNPANHFLDHLKNKTDLADNTVPLIAVPTTAGTGSEATRYAIMYYQKTKYTITHPSIRPWSAILDASLMLSLPPYLFAATAMDALGQAIESYWSVNANNQSKAYAKEAIGLILASIDAAMAKNLDALNAMLKASNLAGRAIEITQTTAPHAMSYGLTTYYGIPHGHGVGLLLPEVYKYNADPSNTVSDSLNRDSLTQTFHELNAILGVSSSVEAVNLLYRLLDRLNLKKVVPDMDIDFLVDKIALDRLANNPVVLTREMLYDIYRVIKTGNR